MAAPRGEEQPLLESDDADASPGVPGKIRNEEEIAHRNKEEIARSPRRNEEENSQDQGSPVKRQEYVIPLRSSGISAANAQPPFQARSSFQSGPMRRVRTGIHVDLMIVFPNPEHFNTPKEEEEAETKFRKLTKAGTVSASIKHVLDNSLLGRSESGAARPNMDYSLHDVFDVPLLERQTTYKKFRIAFLHQFLSFLQDVYVGAEWEIFKSIDDDEYFLHLYLRERTAKFHAEVQNHTLQLNEMVVDTLQIRQKDVWPAWIQYDQENEETFESEHEGVNLFRIFTGTYVDGSIFRATDRIQLLTRVIGMYVDTNDLIKYGLLKSVFPCHQKARLLGFSSWASMRKLYTWRQPISDIRHYFGSEIAFYFAWLSFITKALVFLALPGLLLQLSVLITDRYSYEIGLMIYSLAIAIWSSVVNAKWKQEEKILASQWGEESTTAHGGVRVTSAGVSGIRPDYEGEEQSSYIDESVKIKKQNPRLKLFRRFMSKTFTATFVSIVLICVVGIFWYRHVMIKAKTPMARKKAALMSGIQIKIFDHIWEYLAYRLCLWENYRTERSMKQALIWKIFLFKFINTFNSIFYIAFAKTFIDRCPNDDCIDILSIQVLAVFAVNTSVAIGELVKPWVLYNYQRWREDRKLTSEHGTRSFLEDQEKRIDYTNREQINDYMVIIMQYGFVVMFGNVVPVVALVALLSNLIQIRTDAWKLVWAMKRPFPVEASDIGAWRSVQDILAWMAVFTNVGVSIISTELFADYSTMQRLTIFFVAEHILVAIKLVIEHTISEEPREVVVNRKKREYVIDCLRQGKTTAEIPSHLLMHQNNFPQNLDDFRISFLKNEVGKLDENHESFEKCMESKDIAPPELTPRGTHKSPTYVSKKLIRSD